MYIEINTNFPIVKFRKYFDGNNIDLKQNWHPHALCFYPLKFYDKLNTNQTNLQNCFKWLVGYEKIADLQNMYQNIVKQ